MSSMHSLNLDYKMSTTQPQFQSPRAQQIVQQLNHLLKELEEELQPKRKPQQVDNLYEEVLEYYRTLNTFNLPVWYGSKENNQTSI